VGEMKGTYSILIAGNLMETQFWDLAMNMRIILKSFIRNYRIDLSYTG
jgi:hypothetical protein